MTQTLIEKLEEYAKTAIWVSESGEGGYLKLDDLRAIIEQAKAEKQDADETHNGYIEGTAERLRLICSKLGIGAPVSNEEIMFCQFSLFGAIRRKIDEIYTAPQPDIVAELVQQLLAVIVKKDEALRKIARDAQSRAHAEQIADEAIAIKPEDVELVEVGTVCFEDTLVGVDLTNPTVKHGDTVYTIKTKE